MKRKCLMVGISTVSVILLTLASLTNVVGYQSVKSSGVNDSPLFSVRTKTATNQISKSIITSDYLGKGKEILQFPSQDNKTEILRKFVRIISSMDQRTFEQSIKLCFDKIRKDNTCDEQTLDKIIPIFYGLKSKPNTIMNYVFKGNKDDQTSYVTVCQWHFGCIIESIALLIWIIVTWVSFIFYIIINGPTSFTCRSVCLCVI
jgi:hypothetical protein